eukprot:4081351-Lingulodinium_polyedra.AAC.1
MEGSRGDPRGEPKTAYWGCTSRVVAASGRSSACLRRAAGSRAATTRGCSGAREGEAGVFVRAFED